MLSDPVRPGEPRLEERVEEIRREVLRLGRVTGSPGVRVRSTPGGIAIAATGGQQSEARINKAAEEVSGSAKVLAAIQGTQDTDAYDRSSDNCPVQFQVITDIKYDTSTHKLTFRTRTVTATGITAVSAESALVEITTAEACP